ncbi:MAG: InlB B-repeat-containing protein [Bacilli bacterium]
MKKIYYGVFACLMAGIMVFIPSNFAKAYPVYDVETSDIVISSSGDSTNDNLSRYCNSTQEQYSIIYSQSVDMSPIWELYETIKNDQITLTGNFIITTVIDQKLLVDESKLTVDAVQAAFEAENDSATIAIYDFKETSFNSSTREYTVKFGFKDGVTGATIEDLKVQSGGALPQYINVSSPVGAFVLPASNFNASETIDTSNSLLSGSIYLSHPLTGVVGQINTISNVIENSIIMESMYVINYDGNGNTAGTTPSDDIIYSNLTSPAKVMGVDDQFTKTGYELLGWSTDENATTAMYVEDDIIDTNTCITLYAVWGEVLPVAGLNNILFYGSIISLAILVFTRHFNSKTY